MFRIIEDIVLPTGWHYIQEGQFRIEGSGFEDLIGNVLQWRLDNRRSPGDARRDVTDYICATYPTWCQQSGSMLGGYGQPASSPQPESQGRFVDRVIAWAQELQGHPDTQSMEPQAEAERRAEICRQCTLNVSWENSCPACVTHANRLLNILRQMRNVTHWRKLGGCTQTSMDNRTSVFLPKSVLRRDGVPDHCWLK